MMPNDTCLFPFPHLVNMVKCDGSLFSWPATCKGCKTLVCEKGRVGEIGLCSYGYNYIRATEDIVIAGILLKDFSTNSQARSKRLKKERARLVTKEMLELSIRSIQNIKISLRETLEAEKEKIIDEYVRENQYKPDFLEPLREEIQKGLSFVHDYKQINTQISQNINFIIETRYNGNSFEDKLSQAIKQEKAIYEASKFLDDKLNVAKFLIHPEWLDIQDQCTRFRFHGVMLKYLRIYTSRFDDKGIEVPTQGESYAEIIANPQAVSVIPHTFLDNAAKYSPRNGKVVVYIQDVPGGIDFAVSSFGPRILPIEMDKIFEPFYRGESARRFQEEGAGYGLYISQQVAVRHLGTRINVEQEDRQTPRMGHWTTFSLKIPLKAKILF
jgi:signal transduction histidine kinase